MLWVGSGSPISLVMDHPSFLSFVTEYKINFDDGEHKRGKERGCLEGMIPNLPGLSLQITCVSWVHVVIGK